MRKAELTITQLVLMGIALVVLGVAAWGVADMFTGSGGFYDLAKLIPGFRTAGESNQSLIIGIDARGTSSALEYYDGISWQNFDLTENITINGQDYREYQIREAIYNFYIDTLRIGSKKYSYENLIFEVYDGAEIAERDNLVDQRISPIVSDGSMIVNAEFVPFSDQAPPRIFISLDNQITGENLNLVPREVTDYYIQYRDQILEGRVCEKHILLGGRSYAVRKVDNYLVIDLSKEVGVEKYSPECFRSVEVVSEFPNSELYIKFKMDYNTGSSTVPFNHVLYWKDSVLNRGWYLDTISLDENNDLGDKSKWHDRYYMDSSLQQSFELGLNELLPKLKFSYRVKGNYATLNEVYIYFPETAEKIDITDKVKIYYNDSLKTTTYLFFIKSTRRHVEADFDKMEETILEEYKKELLERAK